MLRRSITLVLCALLLATAAVPAHAGPPDRFEVNFIPNFLDLENGFVVIVNGTRDILCTDEWTQWEVDLIAWIEGGEVGPPPQTPPDRVGLDTIDVQRPDIKSGAVTSLGRGADLYFEMWTIDAFDQLGFVGPCLDTDDSGELFATGTADWMFHASDLAFTDTRALVFRATIDASVTDAAGNEYNYRLNFHDNLTCLDNTNVWQACFTENGHFQELP